MISWNQIRFAFYTVGGAAQVHVLSTGGTESAQAADTGKHPGPAQTSRQVGPATDQV